MKAYKNIERQYYKEIITSFQQPVLSSNGTLGGDSFAVQKSNSWGNELYLSFDNNNSTYSQIQKGQYFIIYNPNPLNITNVYFYYYPTALMTSGKVSGSNDNLTWVELTSFSNSSQTHNLTLSSNDYYKYYKFDVINANGATGGTPIADPYTITITATQQTSVECSAESYYDYYIDILTYKLPKINNVYYGINQ